MYIIFTIILLPLIVFLYLKYNYTYWKRRGVIQLTPTFPFGNVAPLFKKTDNFGHTYKTLYDSLKAQNVDVGGYYFLFKPELLLISPDMIKHILTKDFANFVTRGTYIDEKNDPLSVHLFSLPGEKWKNLRAKLTPAFTSGKMKMMFQTLRACSTELEGYLGEMEQKDEPANFKDILARFTIDVIGSCAFGIECNSLRDPGNQFLKYGTSVISPAGYREVLRQMGAFTIPDILKFLRIPGMNPKTTGFFRNMVKETVEFRESNQVIRNDFMHLLVELKNKGKIEDSDVLTQIKKTTNIGEFSIDQIAGQCFLFFLAGYESSSTTMTFALYELALNQDIQKRAREEIFKTLKNHGPELTYEGIMEMQYLDQIISETLRKYPPLPFLNREVTTDYKLPGTETIIKKGTPIAISLEGLHWDPEFYPNPEQFDPDRFTEMEKAKRPQYSYLPFGEGPRNCIGLRFGLMQTKVGVATILKNFHCTLNEKTPSPLKMSVHSFMTNAEGGVWLNLNKLSS